MHAHEHDHPDTAGRPLRFDEKLRHRIRHWEEHNRDHAASFREWSQKAADAGWTETAECLEKAAAAALDLNRHFRAAASAMERTRPEDAD